MTVFIGNYSVNSTKNLESHYSRELRVCPPPNNVCQQNVEVTRSALGFKIRCLRTVGYTLFCCSPKFLGGGVKRVIPYLYILSTMNITQFKIFGAFLLIASTLTLVACGDSATVANSDAASSGSSNALSSSSATAGISVAKLVYAGQTYKTVVIGTQTWMAENLNVGSMINGKALIPDQNNDAIIEKYCFDDLLANCKTDGALYQWAEAMALPSNCNFAACAASIDAGNHQGICPTGWHIPTARDWSTLTSFLGEETAGTQIKSTEGWYRDFGDNASGFSALAAGTRSDGDGFIDRGNTAHFWEVSEGNATVAGTRYLNYNSTKMLASSSTKTTGFSVRCMLD